MPGKTSEKEMSRLGVNIYPSGPQGAQARGENGAAQPFWPT